MSEENGWIKIHRKIWESPVVTKDLAHLGVWIWLLTHATHKPHDTMFGGRRITLMPGQLITGRKKLASELGIEETKIKRILRDFKSDQQIAQQAKPYGSLITVLNWDKYQERAQQNAQQMPNKCPTSAQQMPTKQECKNDKNERISNNTNGDSAVACASYDSTFDEIWRLTPKHNGRLEGKKPAYAAYLRSIKAGHTPEEIRDGILALAKQYDRDQDSARFIPNGATIYRQERWADALADTGKTETEAWGDEIDQIIEEGLKWL